MKMFTVNKFSSAVLLITLFIGSSGLMVSAQAQTPQQTPAAASKPLLGPDGPFRDGQEEVFSVELCKVSCEAKSRTATPTLVKLQTIAGTTGAMTVGSSSAETGSINTGYALAITPDAYTNNVHVQVDVTGIEEKAAFDGTYVVRPGGEARLGNDSWQIVVTRTQ
jgi:hypothetical protein